MCVIVSTVDVNDCIFCVNEQQKVYISGVPVNQLGSSQCASTINMKHLLYRCIYINFVSSQRRPSNGVLLTGNITSKHESMFCADL